MAYTIRPDATQARQLAELVESTGQRTVSKALLRAAAEYPTLLERIAELEAELARNDLTAVRRELANLTAAVREGGCGTLTLPDTDADSPTFADTAREYLATRDDLTEPVLTNWETTLGYVRFGDVQVRAVTVDDVRDSIMAVWEKRSVADKLLMRARMVFEYAIAKGYRTDNPAGSAKALLPKAKVQRRNHASIAHSALPGVLDAAMHSNARPEAKLALRLVALTAARSGEVRGARVGEFDLDAKTWTVPAGRMKSRREHVVPLSDQAVETIREANRHRVNSVMFSGKNGMELGSKPLSDLLRKHGGTTHGMRGSFKSWCVEQGYRREAVEACLAHKIGLSALEQVYVKTDLLDERRAIMDAWADYLG